MNTALRYAYLDKNDFVATDTHAMVVHSSKEIFGDSFLEPLGDDKILIDYNCLKEMSRKLSEYYMVRFIDLEEYQIEVNGVIYKTINLNKTVLKYPDYNVVFPDENTRKTVDKIGINSKILDNLRQAIDPNVKALKLYFNGNSRAIVVKADSHHIENFKAIIMPTLII